ncbi:hypothetical protein Cflav_PD6072 [Pedosphaera parvula Ellin514]|uniref:Uncharacterized protein n=1 Tax=Pedosphaera parvula (strain Ellin514) TaxID=320771 RepID=B9XA96_PEDPL|nr:hypothetical protein Cflav_PD6072 [Pedosphaera parvula Ellin514]
MLFPVKMLLGSAFSITAPLLVDKGLLNIHPECMVYASMRQQKPTIHMKV